jgi:anthranilate synthase component I
MAFITDSDTLLIEEMEGDVFTPISLFQRIMGTKKFLFESSLKHEDDGRYSFIGANPIYELIASSHCGEIVYRNGTREGFSGNPLLKIKELLPARSDVKGLDIPFLAGGIGYVGYDMVRQFEHIGAELADDIGLADIHLMFFEIMIVFDHLKQKIYLVGTPLLPETTKDVLQTQLQELKKQIFEVKEEEPLSPVVFSSFQSEMSKAEYIKKVETAKEYIQKGDIFQIVLSQRMKATYSGKPFDFYRKLRVQNPTPYMYYIDFADKAIAGTSPESLIKVKGELVVTNPIAGTRLMGLTPELDQEEETVLKQDEKEVAEHKMLVDLGRNDLGKVCRFGTVKLEKYMEVERFRYVMHLVSEVSGRLKEGITAIDALIACLPAGTVSGAPKIRAMEIINELEVSKRGVYSGAIGYISTNGHMDFALAIRTMLLKEGEAYIQAGAGIVYDSIPEMEYLETLNKLKAFLEEKS